MVLLMLFLAVLLLVLLLFAVLLLAAAAAALVRLFPVPLFLLCFLPFNAHHRLIVPSHRSSAG